jgi:hypothetical protein
VVITQPVSIEPEDAGDSAQESGNQKNARHQFVEG